VGRHVRPAVASSILLPLLAGFKRKLYFSGERR
jgi:hypothetical protein